MKRIILLFACFVLVTALSAQNTLSLTFKGQDRGGAYIQLDSVHVENLTREWSETLIYPDTELILSVTVGVEEYDLCHDFIVYPNPCWGNAYLSKSHMPDRPVRLTVTDVQGRLCAEYSGTLQSGTNVFHITLANPQLYFVSVQTAQGVRSQKLLNASCGDANRVVLVSHYDEESEPGVDYLKKMRFDSDNLFVLGDEMRYTGYATIEDEMKTSVIVTQEQMEDDTIGLVFFRDRIPCSDMPTVTDHEGNVYTTVQIGAQCWTRDNMRATTSPTTGACLIPSGAASLSYSGKVARWYNNDSTTYAPQGYGLLYNWNAAVDTFNEALGELSVSASVEDAANVSFAGPRRGICPEGWHVPSAAEWTAFVNYVKAEGIYACDNSANKIAKAFASQTGWNNNSTACAIGQNQSANDALNFTAMPAGYIGSGGFISRGETTGYWSSSQNSIQKAYTWDLFFNNTGIYQTGNSKSQAYSVRCVRD